MAAGAGRENGGRTEPNRRRGRIAFACVLGAAVLAAGWFAVTSTLSLRAATARAELEARLSAITGQPVFVDGRTEFDLFPRPRLDLHDVRVGGDEPGQTLSIDQVRAELDLSDALFGRTDIAALILIRPELTAVEAGSGRAAPPLDAIASADEPAVPAPDAAPGGGGEQELAVRYARSVLGRFEGVRQLELREGVVRPGDGAAVLSSVNLRLDWPSRHDEARLSGSFVWNGQTAQVETRLSDPVRFLDGGSSTLRLSLASPSLDARFEGEGASGDQLAFDGTLRLSTPSLARAVHWLGGAGRTVPDIGAVSLETRIRHEPGARTAMDPVRLALGEQSGHGILEAAFRDGGRPVFSGTLAFPELDLDRVARGIAPMPRHALDFQRPMAVSFIEAFDLDLRVSAGAADFGDTPLRQLAASVMVSGGIATLDVGDAEILDGRAQGRLSIDLSGPRPMARGRLDMVGVEAAGLASLAGLRSVGLAGRADLRAEFEAPATNWAEVLRDNTASARLTLAQGSVRGLSPAMLSEPGERPLRVEAGGESVPVSAFEARFGTRGPFATLDALSLRTGASRLEAGGFISLLDDRLFVEGSFAPSNETAAMNDLFTTSQLVPFKMLGEWPSPTLVVGEGVNIEPI